MRESLTEIYCGGGVHATGGGSCYWGVGRYEQAIEYMHPYY